MNEQETRLIDESIAAYKRTIKFLKSQIHDLEQRKLRAFIKDCPECFKIVNKKEQ